MTRTVLWCLAGFAVSTASRDEPAFDGTSALVDQIRAKANSMLSEYRAQGAPGEEGSASDDTFNETFFRDNCDLTEYQTESFDDAKYQFSANEAEDNGRWAEGKKCADPKTGGGLAFTQEGVDTAYDCAKACDAKTSASKGEVMCCEFHQDKHSCSGFWGWQSLEDSKWGTNHFFRFFNRRHPKRSRLMMSPRDLGDGDIDSEKDALDDTLQGQEHVKELIKQVNAVSIEGILNHLLSFYICMRWVPDKDFVDLAKFELEHVSVDAATPAEGPRTRDNVMEKLVHADITPLRCGSAINVQHNDKVDQLMARFNNTESDLYQLYTFSKNVWAGADSGVFNGLFVDEIKSINKAMHWSADSEEDSVYVQDMRQVARRGNNLPWMTFVRSSNDYYHHYSQSKNLFMVCFGPRVASFPHKRENGQHVLADGNMAGCNGFWDWETMADQINRIKQLFAPDMCFEHTLRKELSAKFLDTFVEMNQEFELAMQNRFAKRVHMLDPTKDVGLDILSDTNTTFDGADRMSSKQTDREYKKVAHLVANAASKWVICPTKPGTSDAAFGNEDNFFRNPRAYKKWIGEITDETIPQCNTFDPVTGCVKCIVAVMDDHRCHVRLNVTLDDVFKAIRRKQYPFLQSRYTTEEEFETERGWEVRQVTKNGACMVRKSIATAQEAEKTGNVQDIRDAFFNVNASDSIVDVVPRHAPEMHEKVDSDLRFSVSRRKKAYEEFVKDGGIYDPSVTDRLITAVTEETYLDRAFDWQKKFIFTHDEPELPSSNRPAHKVDYFMSCPCTVSDFGPSEHFAQFGGIGMGDYYNFR